jgi:hypothetical protein
MTPEYPVVSNTALLVPAINSPNFNLQNPTASPSPSWAILQNGLAYFFGLVLSGGTITGPDYIFNQQGLVFYNGAPALGNVVMSIAAASFVDQFGNVITGPGIIAYNQGSTGYAALLSGTAPVLVLEPPGTITMTIAPQLQGFADNAGAANEQLLASLFSGQETAGNANSFVHVFSESNDGTVAAQGELGISGVTILQWTQDGVFVWTGNGAMGGRPDFAQVDNTNDTNANNGTQPCTQQWSVPAGDPKVGTVYEIESPFNGLFETATLGFKPSLNGVAQVTSGGDSIGAGFFPAGTAFTGNIRLRMIIRTIGTGGTADIFINGDIGNSGGRASGTNSEATPLSSQLTAVAFNTQANNTIAIDTVWGAAVANQTITNHGSVFTRKGP